MNELCHLNYSVCSCSYIYQARVIQLSQARKLPVFDIVPASGQIMEKNGRRIYRIHYCKINQLCFHVFILYTVK